MPYKQYHVTGIDVTITIIQGRNLVAKDRNVIGKKTTSDTYIKCYCGGRSFGITKTAEKTLNPRWNQTFKVPISETDANDILQGFYDSGTLEFHLFDEDKLTKDDPMGTVTLNLPIKSETSTCWYPIGKGTGGNYCKNATGDIEIKIDVAIRKFLQLKRGNSQSIPGGTIHVGLGWEIESGNTTVDLDASCIAIDPRGDILMDESVYFGSLSNSNGSIRHSGDERTGDEDIEGSGDDEMILCNLDNLPRRVFALYFILTVATPGTTLADVQSALVSVSDPHTGACLGQFAPSYAGEHTAMFLMRIARDVKGTKGWVQSIIEDTTCARDFGLLIPEIKGYSRDIVPNIMIDLDERIAVMKKGGNIRLKDFCRSVDNEIHEVVTMGFSWDVTKRTKVELDPAAICLNEKFEEEEIIFYKNLLSHNEAIQLSGYKPEGDEMGDNETISLTLNNVPDSVKYIVFALNSHSGFDLGNLSKFSCRLFDPQSRMDIAIFNLSNFWELRRHTSMFICYLYRDSDDSSWSFHIMSEPTNGLTPSDLIPEVQLCIENNPPSPPIVPLAASERQIKEMPENVPILDE